MYVVVVWKPPFKLKQSRRIFKSVLMLSHFARRFGQRSRWRLTPALIAAGAASSIVGLGWAHAQSAAVADEVEGERELTPFQKSLTRGVGVACYNANYPVEDRGLLADDDVIESEGNDRFRVFGVFDGHGGWQVRSPALCSIVEALDQSRT